MRPVIEALLKALPSFLQRRISHAHVSVLAQFIQFGIVGAVGFVVDTSVVYALRAPAGLYVAGVAAYLVAVTTTWWVNRIWTFRGFSNVGPMSRQLAQYAVVNIPGLLLNLGTYFILIASSRTCAAYPVIAVAAGAFAGMFANFGLSRALVFR